MNISNILAGQYTPQQINKIIAKAKQLPYDEQVELANLLGQYENILKVQKCQNNFIDFVKEMWPAFIPGRHHDIMADAFERVANGTCKRLIINMAPRHALSLDTKIITAEGWKTIAEIEVGDMVFHPDGNPVEVIGVSNIFTDREIYRVSTDDGRYVDVDGEHLWTVRLSRKHGVFHTYSTEDLHRRQSGAILKTKRGGGVYIKETDSDGKSIRNPMLPAVSPLNIRDVDLPIDPYMLGVWLGDGSKNNGVITQHDEDQRILRPIIESKGYKTTDQSTRFTFGVLGLKEQLRSIGVLFDKHIPEQYIMSSPTQRMELVRGLMDTDGNVSKVGQCFLANKNKRIIDSFRIILHSLGIKNSLLEQRVFLYGKYHGLHYKVSFYAKDISKLPRKNDRAVGHTKAVGRYISIKKLNFKSETRCIKVNREDGLFLAGEGMIPTHNTKSEFSSYLLPAWFLGKYPDKKIIQTAHTAELAVGFGRKVRNLVGNPHYQKIFPNVSLSSDSKAAGRWNTNKGGDYFAIGIGGAVTGKGADCAYFSCKCLTLNGMLPVSQVKVGQEVYGYNHKLGRSEWTRVLAVSTQYKPELVSVGGFICTPDHRIYDGSDYTKASEARSATVLPMWERLSSLEEGARKITEEKGDDQRVEVLLLERLPGGRGDLQQVSTLRRMESADGSNMQGMLSEGQACEGQLLSLQEGLHEGFFGVQEGRGEEREPESLLHEEVLFGLEVDQAKNVSSPYRDMQYLQISVPGEEKVLQQGVLLEEESQEHYLRRGVGRKEEIRKEEGQRGLCLLPSSQGQVGGTSHQPGRDGQQSGEPDTTLRVVSQPLSSHRIGTCAEDLKSLLRGSGHWVVDIQTESKNFFCEGVLAHNCLIIDDPHSEQEAAIAAANPSIYDGVYEWYTSGPRQRLQPGGAIVIVMTRWSKRDLCGQILKASSQKDGLDEWEVIEFPAIMPSGNPLWPEFWPLEELEKIKAELPVAKWNAQYQQNPTSEEGALVKREWWQIWEKDEPPVCEYIIQSWDTALTKGTRSDYSACTTWGIFYEKDNDGKRIAKIILLNAYQDKLEFPELKQKALEEYRYWKPDCCIIEAKAAGGPLVFELRKMGIPIQDYTPSRGNDKIVRVNAVSDIFASGFVYAPPLRWAEELIEQFASFPNSDHDDLVDSSTQALLRFRQGGFISTQSDEDEEYVQNKKADYY